MRVKVSTPNPSPEKRIGQPAVASAEHLGNIINLSGYGPATRLLQQIHSEHLYFSPKNASHKKPGENAPLNPDIYSDEESDYEDDLLSLQLPVSFGSKDNYRDKQSSQSGMFNINADSIQRHFQDMIDMTLLAPLPDTDTPRRRSPRINKVNFVDSLPGSSESKTKSNIKKNESEIVKVNKEKQALNYSNIKSQNESTKSDPGSAAYEKKQMRKKKRSNKAKQNTQLEVATEDRVPVNDEEWKTLNKAMDLERELTSYLKHAEELMLKKWAEYLTLTSTQLRRCEVKNAKDAGMVKDVIDMLEDGDRYVWQLIDELVLF